MADRGCEPSARAGRPIRASWLRIAGYLGIGALCAVPAGCSTTRLDPEVCEDTQQCRDGFGLGSSCARDGFCTEPSVPARCRRTFPENLIERPDLNEGTILIGTVFSHTDNGGPLQAAELAVRQAAITAGLDGRSFGVVHCDYTEGTGDGLTEDLAIEQITRFLADDVQVPAIVGAWSSSETEASFNNIRDDQVVLISPSSTSPALTALDGMTASFDAPGFLWRTAPPDTLQSEVIAQDMRTRDVRRVAALFQTGAYGDGLTSLFISRFMELGGESVDQFPFSTSDFAALVAQIADGIRDDRYEEVLFVSSDLADHVSLFFAATATPDLENQWGNRLGGLFLADAAFSADLLADTAGQAAVLFPKIRGTRPAPAEGVVFNAFAAAYSATYADDAVSSPFLANAYDAAWLSIYGTVWSHFNEGRINGLGVARGLRSVSSGGPLDIVPSAWDDVVGSFRTGTPIDVRGASGGLDFDPTTEETSATIETWRVVPDMSEPSGWSFERISLTDP